MRDVVSLGSLNVDYIHLAEELSFLEPFYPEGGYQRQWTLEDPQRIERLQRVLKEKSRLLQISAGGSGANLVYALTRMGFSCGLMGKIGRDKEADFLLEENRVIPFQHILRNEKTGKSLIILGPSRDRTIIRVPLANQTWSWNDVDMDFLLSFSILHLTSLPGEGLSLQIRLVEELGGRVKISFDPGEIYVRKGLAALTPLLIHCDWLFITEEEWETLTGLSLEKSIGERAALGVRCLVIKRKGGGAKILRGAEAWELPGERIQAVDTTGAGDVFAAGFLAGALKGCPPLDCGRIGLTLSQKSMMGLGRSAYPTKEDLERTLILPGVED